MANIKVEEQIGGVLIQPKGEFIGGEETDELHKILKKAAEKPDNNAIVDLGRVTYINSTALGILIAAHTTFTRNGGKIILANISKGIENIFVITKLTLVFTIAESVDKAISIIKKEN